MIENTETNNQHELFPSIYNLPVPTPYMAFFDEQEKCIKNKSIFEFDVNENNNQDNEKSNDEIKRKKGPWSPEEDEKLMKAVKNSNPIIWDVVAEKVEGRTPTQCKERWFYRLHPDVKKTKFQKWEDRIIINERNIVGNHWTIISNKLPGRTPYAVKNRWYSVLRYKVDKCNLLM